MSLLKFSSVLLLTSNELFQFIRSLSKILLQLFYIRDRIWLWFRDRVCSTENFLSPMFSPYLQSLEQVTSQVSGGDLRVKYIALGLHIHFFWWSTKIPHRMLTNQKPKLVIRNCQWNCMLTYRDILLCNI